MAISDWPAAERPRERLLALGARVLSDAELIALFLRTGIKGKSAVELAREMLAGFGGLSGLLSADQAALRKVKGLGAAKFAQIAAVHPVIDVLINNAAVYEPFTVAEASDDQILSIILTDLAGPVFCCRSAIPMA